MVSWEYKIIFYIYIDLKKREWDEYKMDGWDRTIPTTYQWRGLWIFISTVTKKNSLIVFFFIINSDNYIWAIWTLLVIVDNIYCM